MSIPPLLAQADLSDWPIILIAIAVPIALLFVGVFRGRNIVGPARLDQTERVSQIWGIFCLGLLVWLFSQSLAAEMVRPQQTSATTAPATQPAENTPRQLVAASVVSAIAVSAALIISNIYIRQNGLQKVGLTRRLLPKGITIGIISILVALPLVFVATALTQATWDAIGYEHPNAHELLRFLRDASPSLQTLTIISAVALAPVAEELLFRGHLQTAILYTIDREGNSAAARWIAILLASIVFTAFHIELWMMPPIFCLSLCLGYVYERTGNLWVSILIHASFNAANVIYFYQQTHH